MPPITSPQRLREILTQARVVAVVGYSPNPERPAHWIAQYLKDNGYRVIPVNPGLDEALGERCYRTLADLPDSVDLVNIFRSPPAVPEIVVQAIEKRVKVVWMQEGAENADAASAAEAAGLEAVVGRCIFRDHASFVKGT